MRMGMFHDEAITVATCRIFAPSVYIFFASVIPALAFGEQIEHHTHGKFNGVHVLLSAAIAGVVQVRAPPPPPSCSRCTRLAFVHAAPLHVPLHTSFVAPLSGQPRAAY